MFVEHSLATFCGHTYSSVFPFSPACSLCSPAHQAHLTSAAHHTHKHSLSLSSFHLGWSRLFPVAHLSLTYTNLSTLTFTTDHTHSAYLKVPAFTALPHKLTFPFPTYLLSTTPQEHLHTQPYSSSTFIHSSLHSAVTGVLPPFTFLPLGWLNSLAQAHSPFTGSAFPTPTPGPSNVPSLTVMVSTTTALFSLVHQPLRVGMTLTVVVFEGRALLPLSLPCGMCGRF